MMVSTQSTVKFSTRGYLHIADDGFSVVDDEVVVDCVTTDLVAAVADARFEVCAHTPELEQKGNRAERYRTKTEVLIATWLHKGEKETIHNRKEIHDKIINQKSSVCPQHFEPPYCSS